MNNPVNLKYEFRGFRLLKASIDRMGDKPLKSFNIQARKKVYDNKNSIYELVVEININFGDEVSNYLFSAGFKINDLEWLEVMADQTVINELFQVVFPYLREKISEFTSDFRPGFLIPTFDFRQFDFSKSINFNLEIRNVSPKKEENNNLVN